MRAPVNVKAVWQRARHRICSGIFLYLFSHARTFRHHDGYMPRVLVFKLFHFWPARSLAYASFSVLKSSSLAVIFAS
jgi:hypothetical protein